MTPSDKLLSRWRHAGRSGPTGPRSPRPRYSSMRSAPMLGSILVQKDWLKQSGSTRRSKREEVTGLRLGERARTAAGSSSRSRDGSAEQAGLRYVV